MPGPMPKNPSMRQRRNKKSSRALLPAPQVTRLQKPRLPRLSKGQQWHPAAKRFWTTIWNSPMSVEFVPGDEPALCRLALLVNAFWLYGSLDVAKEIRALEREFGLTPMSRRRLEWAVAQTDEARDRHEHNRAKRAKTAVIDVSVDPRGVLDQ